MKSGKHIDGKKISRENPLVKWFLNTQDHLFQEKVIKNKDGNTLLKKEDIEFWLHSVSENQKLNYIRDELMELRDEIRRLDAIIFFPSYYKDELMGILALGEKQNGFFRPEELLSLQRLAENAAMVFKGSQLTASVIEAENIKKLEKAKSEFFANVSHELRTPLTNIILPIQNVLEKIGHKISPENREEKESILRNAQRLLKRINEILDVSKLESGKMELKANVRDVNSILEDIVAASSIGAKERGIDLLFKPDHSISKVYVDTEKIEKVFSNLVSNALKFTNPKGKVEILTREGADHIEVMVSDTGIGIAQADLLFIFERFRQLDGSSSRKYEGTGIGLSLAKELVEMHHGSIEVTSELNKGSIFTVRLLKGRGHLQKGEIREDPEKPRAGDGLAELNVADRRKGERREGDRRKMNAVDRVSIDLLQLQFSDMPQPHGRLYSQSAHGGTVGEVDGPFGYDTPFGYDGLNGSDGSDGPGGLSVSDGAADGKETVKEIVNETTAETISETILVVDDNTDLAANIAHCFTQGYQVLIAYNGKQALDIIVRKLPSLVISDVMMPEMDGYELCERIKSCEKTQHIPVILLTAKAAVEDRIAGLQFGADDYLAKPFNAKELMAVVDSLLTKKKLQAQLSKTNQELKKALHELKETEAELVHTAKLASVGQLAAGVAHEIHNPASAIDNCFQIITKKVEKAKSSGATFDEVYPDLAKPLALGKASLSRIQYIVDSLLGFSRKNREGFNYVDIHTGIDNTLSLLEHQCKGMIQIHKEFGQIEKVEVDLQQINQVFMNLLSNAIHAIETKRGKGEDCGNIWISTGISGENVIVKIKDDGIGISKDNLVKIFDPFFTTKELGKGTGLGLNISYRIMKNHNGSIEVESKENEGTAFVLKIPRKAVHC
ncbi:MAG: ATP-binding protein [bacterium]